ncbi:MAG: methylglyoxal synthase [Tissierellales bacterium]|jgi:methylglyoxal synthase|nr:methylglyoxal synthase [Tissierellales bacterium]
MSKIKMDKIKKIALVAHDNRKQDLLEWVSENKEKLSKHKLFGTGSTSKLVRDEIGIEVKSYKSGPLGGDQQIGSKISEGKIDFMIFFWDPLTSQPHDPDVKALLRIAVLYDIPVAMNRATADFLFYSEFIDKEYTRKIINYEDRYQRKLDKY